MSYNYLPLDKTPTNFQQIKNLLEYNQLVSITFDAHSRITECRAYLDKKIEGGEDLYYGINTGFGYLQNVHIDKAQLQKLQVNLPCGGPIVSQTRILLEFAAKSMPSFLVEMGR